ncbi:MAG TPA: hypothetical protein VNJ11_12335 [Bryobacteraceae bacterium]|nr:hypothetical protein [Bryobacteraceae bacterium]
MPEQIFLSLWLRDYSFHNMPEHFQKLLELFPFSTQAPAAPTMKIYAIEYAEPPALEQRLPPGATAAEVVEMAREFLHEDCACVVEAHWDLWQYEGVWKLLPSPVTLSCHGPLFESLAGDHLRIEAGLDAHFLPRPEAPGHLAKVQSNIRSLLRLSRELEAGLPVERRQLWTETGESFLEKLQAYLDES